MLSILIESFVENEEEGEPVIARDEEQFPVEGLTDVEWTTHRTRRADSEHAQIQRACLLRLSVLHKSRSIGSNGFKQVWKINAETVMKRDNCKHRHDIASRLIDFEWFVCLDDTFVQRLQTARSIHVGDWARTSEFSSQEHLREHVERHHQLGKSEGAKRKEVATYAARSRPGHWLFLSSRIGIRVGHMMKDDHFTKLLADGEWDKVALRMISELIINKQTRVEVFEHS